MFCIKTICNSVCRALANRDVNMYSTVQLSCYVLYNIDSLDTDRLPPYSCFTIELSILHTIIVKGKHS